MSEINFQPQSQFPTNRGLIILTIMMMAILEVLDSTIVNVSLPYMMPTLGADTEQITWVLTSYVVTSAMMLPLTGFLSNRVGYKRLLLIDIIGFGIASVLCGLSQTLVQIVIFRLLQGAFGAALIPLSQSILRQSFSLKEQGKAMAIWGIGIMAAPIFGPTLGGYITSHLDWRWVFYINLPVILIAVLLIIFVIPKSPAQKIKIDWFGILLMFGGVSSLQILLDRGNSENWFRSHFILLLLIISIICITFFLIRSFYCRHPIIKLTTYRDRNFAISSLLFAIFAACMSGLITLEPLMFENLFGFTAETAGITMAPLGIASALGMIGVSSLITKINTKYIITTGLILSAIGSFYLSRLNLTATRADFMYANFISGLGFGIFMIPISTYSLATIPRADITEASGLFSYARMLGSSFGISLLGTLVARETQTAWNQLSGSITPFNNNLQIWLQTQHLTLQNKITVPLLAKTLLAQANMLAFIDAYYLLALLFLAMIVLVLFIKQVELTGSTHKPARIKFENEPELSH